MSGRPVRPGLVGAAVAVLVLSSAVSACSTSHRTNTTMTLAASLHTDSTPGVDASTAVTFSGQVGQNTRVAAVYGQPVTFTATIDWGDGTVTAKARPTGTVQFFDGARKLASVDLTPASAPIGDQTFFTIVAHSTLAKVGSGALQLATALDVGTHEITTVYVAGASGGTWRGSTSRAVTVTVTPAATSTALVVVQNSPALGSPTVTFTATVTATSPGAGTPTGTVQFLDGHDVIGTGSLTADGTSTLTLGAGKLSAGPQTITAVYQGSNSYTGSTSVAEGRAPAPATTTSTTPTTPTTTAPTQPAAAPATSTTARPVVTTTTTAAPTTTTARPATTTSTTTRTGTG